MIRRLATLLPALLLAAPAPIWAYRFMCNSMDENGNVRGSDGCACNLQTAQRWTTGIINWRIKRTAPSGMTSTQWMTAAGQAIAGWETARCRNFSMRDSGDVSSPDFGDNQAQQTVFWITNATDFQRIVGGGIDGVLGVTVAPYYFQGNCQGRETVDSDIVMNAAAGFTWTTNMGACSGDCVNVASVLLHEMGHAQGLGHPCTGNNDCPTGGAIMAAVSGYREDLVIPLQDDVNGICALYPGTPGALGSSCSVSTDCTSRLCINDNGVKYCSQTCGTCPTGFRCTNSQCVRAGAPRVGEACTGSCESGALCLEDSPTSRKCYKQCTPGSTPTGCATGERCADLGQNVGACVPEGTRRPGEECGGSFGDCISGATCYIVEEGATTGICFQDCTRDIDCGSGRRCLISPSDGGTSSGVCVGARSEGATCGEGGFDTMCAEGLICLCYDSQCTAGRCVRECTNQPSVCLAGQRCELLSDNQTSVCIQEVGEGQGCNEAVCAAGLLCVQSGGSQYRCFRDCSQQACPSGKTCHTYNQGTSSQFSICEDAPPPRDGGADGGVRDGGTQPPLRGFGEACGANEECESGLCADLPGRDRVCATACDPRLGHYECGHGAEREGCVPFNAEDLGQGGLCVPGGQTGDLGFGQACRGREDCESGICDERRCSIWCELDGTCPGLTGYSCDQTEAQPGVCRRAWVAPKGQGSCGSAPGEGAAGTGALLALLGLVGFLRLRGRRASATARPPTMDWGRTIRQRRGGRGAGRPASGCALRWSRLSPRRRHGRR
jgi:MYXO-CTERM domain-containing protein